MKMRCDVSTLMQLLRDFPNLRSFSLCANDHPRLDHLATLVEHALRVIRQLVATFIPCNVSDSPLVGETEEECDCRIVSVRFLPNCETLSSLSYQTSPVNQLVQSWSRVWPVAANTTSA